MARQLASERRRSCTTQGATASPTSVLAASDPARTSTICSSSRPFNLLKPLIPTCPSVLITGPRRRGSFPRNLCRIATA